MKKDVELNLTAQEQKQVDAALETVLGPPLEEETDAHAEELRDLKRRGAAALKQAERAAHRGNMAEAKKWNDVAQQIVATARRVAEIEPQPPSHEEDEAIREELRARINKYVEQDGALTQWRMRREMWEEMCAEARETGAPMPKPMPPRPPHWSDKLPEDVRLKVLGF